MRAVAVHVALDARPARSRAARPAASHHAAGRRRRVDVGHARRPVGAGRRRSSRPRPWPSGRPRERFHPPKGWRLTTAPVVAAVDVEVAGLRRARASTRTRRVERVEAGGEPVGHGVLPARSRWSRSGARMTPSTGPNHSVRWLHEPGCTPSLHPGRQRWPVSSSCRGSTSQDSPSLEAWSARAAAAASAGRMSGPIVVAGSGAGDPRPQAGHRVAQLAQEGRVVVHRRLDDGQAGRRALLAGVAEGRGARGRVPRGRRRRSRPSPRSRSCRWSRRAGCRSGRHEVNSRAVSNDPVSTTASTSSWVTRCRPTSSSRVGRSCRTSRGTPASQKVLDELHGGGHRLGRGLEDDGVARGERRERRRRPGSRRGSSTAGPRPPRRRVLAPRPRARLAAAARSSARSRSPRSPRGRPRRRSCPRRAP